MPLQNLTNTAQSVGSPVPVKRAGARREWKLAGPPKGEATQCIQPETENAEDPAVEMDVDMADAMPPCFFAAMPASPEMLAIACAGEWAESRRQRDMCGVKRLMASVGLEEHAAAATAAGYGDLQSVLQMSSSREQLEQLARAIGLAGCEMERLVDGLYSPAESSSC